MDKRYAYLFPCDAEQVLRVDCHTDELKLIGPSLLDGINKFQNGFCGRDGCLYGIPQRATGVLRVVPGGASDGEDHVDLIPCGENMLSVKDKFEGKLGLLTTELSSLLDWRVFKLTTSSPSKVVCWDRMDAYTVYH